MADIRLISILPPQTPVKGPQASQGAGGSSATTDLSNLENGTTLSGFIVNRDANGNPVLRTDSGDITFASNFFLKIGSEVTIRVDNTASGSLARILTVDGQPPEIAETTSGFANQPEVFINTQHRPPSALVALNASVPANLAPEAPGTPIVTLFGTLIKPQTPAPATPLTPSTATSAPSSPLPTGTQITFRVLSIETAPPSPTAPQPTNQPANLLSANYATYARAAATPLPATPTAASPAPPSAPPATPVNSIPETLSPIVEAPLSPNVTQSLTPNLPSPPLPTAQTLTQLVQTTATPPAPAAQSSPTPAQNPVTFGDIPTQPAPATPTPALSGQIIPASVLGHETSGESLLQTPLGVVRLQAETPVPASSNLTLQVLQTTPPALTNLSLTINPQGAPLTTQPAPLLQLAQSWSSLQQIFAILLSQPQPADTTSLATLPTSPNAATPTPKDIGPALMVFITALRGGDFKSWLGKDTIKLLESQGQANLVKKAEAEFTTIATQYAEARPGHWQALFFPIAVDGMVQQLRLFTKRDRKQGGSNQPDQQQEDTRFVVEVTLTQLGELQLDGFVRKQPKEVNFDLVIRSAHPLDEDIRRDILAIYDATGAITGYRGSLAFQTVKDFPVNPMQEIATHNRITA